MTPTKQDFERALSWISAYPFKTELFNIDGGGAG